MKKLLVSLFLLGSSTAYSSGMVDYIEIDGPVVYFTTTQSKTHTLPLCVDSNQSDLWSLSLASDPGRAMYSLMLQAMEKGEEITVTSGDDCAVVQGTERVASLSLSDPAASAGSSEFELIPSLKTLAYARRQLGSCLIYNTAVAPNGNDYMIFENNDCACKEGSTYTVNAVNSGFSYVSCTIPVTIKNYIN